MARLILVVIIGTATVFAGLGYLSRWDGVVQDRVFYADKKSSGPLKIAVFGTSLSARANWPDELATALHDCGLVDTEVRRFAQAGANSSWGVAHLEWLGYYSPDLVIVEFAMNDADVVDGLWPGNSRSNLDEIVTRLRRKAPDVAIMLLSTNPVTGWARLKRPFLGRYYTDYLAISAQQDIGLLDGYGRWMQLPGRAADIPDGVHPVPDVEARLLTRPIAEAIAVGFGAGCRTGNGRSSKG